MAFEYHRYPWKAYIIDQYVYQPDPYQIMINLLGVIPPDLVPCKIWYSSLTQKDINFLVAFCFINRDLINIGHMTNALEQYNDSMSFAVEEKITRLWNLLHENTEEGRQRREYYYGWDAASGRVLNCNWGERGEMGSIYGPPVGTRRFVGNQGQALVDECVGFQNLLENDDGYDGAMSRWPFDEPWNYDAEIAALPDYQ